MADPRDLSMARKSSFIGKSTGSEAAQSTGGGVVTAVVQGKAYFESYSMDVLVEGADVPRHMDMLTHNHASHLEPRPVPLARKQRRGATGTEQPENGVMS
jgi:hypothetical protein